MPQRPARNPLLALAATLFVLGVVGWWQLRQSGAAQFVAITAVEVEFIPRELTLHTGKITIRLNNGGNDQHNLVLAGPNGRDIGGVPSIMAYLTPNQVAEKTFTLGAGTYSFYCAWSNHYQLGMTGVLVVK